MSQKPWFEHLDNLEQLYGDDFFRHQNIDPSQNISLTEQLFPPSFVAEAQLTEEASLSVDIYADDDNLYIISPMAGVMESSLEITLENDLLTIKGRRHIDFDQKTSQSLIYHECFWGKFSRSLVLPVAVDSSNIKATLKNGVLKIILPKLRRQKKLTFP